MAGAADEEGGGSTSRLTIVVADDSPGALALMEEVLKGAADEVVTARDGEAAWRAIQQHRPRVAILDDQMPGRTGLEVAALVEEDPNLAETRVVLVTGEATPEAAAAAGIRRVLLKP